MEIGRTGRGVRARRAASGARNPACCPNGRECPLLEGPLRTPRPPSLSPPTPPLDPMSDPSDLTRQAKREYAQLLRLHERLLAQLGRVLDDVASPNTSGLLKEIKARTGSAPPMGDVANAVEEAIRTLKLSESQVRRAVMDRTEGLEVEGVPNLPAHLQRFLGERASQPGFSFEVQQDEVRGWMICWKEYTSQGTVRGYGQFYERPYAWIED